MLIKPVESKSIGQNKYIESIEKNILTICTGFCGTGKSYIALGKAIELIDRDHKKYRKIIIVKPYMPTSIGEKLGALPGTLDEKIIPYVEGIKDNLFKLGMPEASMNSYIKSNIEFAILSTCRGRSFSNCIVIVEEAQNVPVNGGSMLMLLTRIGNNCKMIIQGDLDQKDISCESGLDEAIKKISGLDGVGIVELNEVSDIQRSKIVSKILERYKQ